MVVVSLLGGCTSDGASRPDAASATPVDVGVPYEGPSGSSPLPLGEVVVVDLPLGRTGTAPVSVAVRAIRRGDDQAVDRRRQVWRGPRERSYYVDVSLTFEGIGRIRADPLFLLASGSRARKVLATPITLAEPLAQCHGGDSRAQVMRAGENLDLCLVFVGPREDRIRGIVLEDVAGTPTWRVRVSSRAEG
jgi:hypothetical protein